MKNFRKKLPAICFLGFLLLVSAAAIVLPDKKISRTERRTLAGMPEFTPSSILDKTYMERLETYFLDQFPFRDVFRTVKAETETRFFAKADVDGYFAVNDGIYCLDAELNEKKVKRAAAGIEALIENNFQTANCYYAIIPDKNYYLGEQKNYPVLEYDRLNAILAETVTSAQSISLYEKLELSDYYRTDLHWKQECILDVADGLVLKMQEGKTAEEEKTGESKTKEPQSEKPEEVQTAKKDWQTATDNFIGAYGAASALLTKPDIIYYYNSSEIQAMQVYDYEKQETVGVYAPEKIGGTDDYDVYLWGARALLTIQNPDSPTERKLLCFRDSFGSSLAPLLAESYQTVTLVDLRYVSASYAMQLLGEETYDDVLFLYSVPVLNHGDSLRF